MKLKNLTTFLPKSKIKAGAGINNGKFPFFTSSDTLSLYIDDYLYDCEAIILGTGGKPSCNYYNGKFSVSTDNFVIITNNINTKFLYYFLRKDNLLVLEKGFHGAGLKHIGKDYISEIEVPCPPMIKQQKIVSVLDKINEIISNDKRQLDLLDELIKSRFVEILSDTKKIQVESLEKISELIFAGGDRPVDTSEIKNDEYRYPVFANAETNNGLLCYSKDYKVDKPCVTIAARGCTVGFTAVRNEKFTPVVRLITIIPKNYVLPIYLKNYLDNEISIEGNGAAQPQLTVPTVKKYIIKIPTLEAQNEFASFVEQIDKLKFNIQQHIKLMQELLDKKMDEYFGGNE